MFVYIILSLGIGLILGLFGLIPTMHINNILPYLNYFAQPDNINAFVVIFSSILFSFLSVIATTLFFIPNTDNYIALMPLQKYYLRGMAYQGIYLSIFGVLFAIIVGMPFIILFILYLPYLKPSITLLTPYILLITLFILLLNVRNIFGYLVLLLAGILGYLVLHNFIIVPNPLFVLIVGMFGFSNIYFVLNQDIKKVKQTYYTNAINKYQLFLCGLASTLLSIIVTLFPGMGSGVASYIGAKILNKNEENNNVVVGNANKFDIDNKDDYIMLNAGINVLVIILSFFAYVDLGKSRTGSAYWFGQYVSGTFLENKFILFFIILFCIILSIIITISLAKLLINLSEKFNPKFILLFTSAVIIITLFLLSNITGFFVFIISTLIGIICIKSNNPRILLMSVIIVPVLSYFI